MIRMPSKFDLLKLLKKISFLRLAYIALAVFALVTLVINLTFFWSSQEKPELSNQPKTKKIRQPIIIRDETLSNRNYQEIKERNLFNSDGKFPNEDIEERKKISPVAVPTRLPLKLRGILHTSDPKSGLVSITLTTNNKTENNSVDTYIFKKELGDVLLTEIYPKKIVFLNKGQKEYLELDPSKQVETVTPNTFVKETKPIGDSFEEEGFKRKGNHITVTEEYKQKLLTTEFAKILRDVRALPYKDHNNNIIGYRLTQLKSGSIFDKIGLKSNDIVTEINGVQLGDASQAIRYLNSLRNAEEVQVEVMRNGKKQDFNLQVQ